jgi:hypothetical protein
MTSAGLHAELEQSRELLLAPLRGLTEEQFRYRPADGPWPIAVHLAHFLRVERAVCAGISTAIAADGPPMASAGASNDGDEAAAQHLAVPQIIHGLQASRRELVALTAGETAVTRILVHERMGRLTVSGLLRAHSGHEREHAAAIERIAQQARTARRVIIPLAPRS